MSTISRETLRKFNDLCTKVVLIFQLYFGVAQHDVTC